MKKLNITKKGKVISGIIIVAVLVIAVVIGINSYRIHERQKQISDYEKQISQIHENFLKKKEHSEKLDSLKFLISEYKQYKKSDKAISEITVKYEEELKTMKRYFTDEYDKILSDNTLEKVHEITDKNKISTNKTNLETLLKSIEDETGTVCTDKEAETYIQSVNKMIASYDTRIKEIEKKEAEEAEAKKAAEEAEAKRLAEEAAAAQAASENNYFNSDNPNSEVSDSGSGNDYYGGGSTDTGSTDSGSSPSDSSSGNGWHVYDSEGNDITDHEPGGYDPNDPVWY